MSGRGKQEGGTRSGNLSARQASRQPGRSNQTGNNTRPQRLSNTRARGQPPGRLPAISSVQETDSCRDPADCTRSHITQETTSSSNSGGTMAVHPGPRVLDPGASSLGSGTALHVPRPPPHTGPSSRHSAQTASRLSPEPLSFPTEESSSLPSHFQAALLSPPLPLSYDPSRNVDRSVSVNRELSFGSLPLSAEDERMRDLIFHGINHFELRNKELKDYNCRLLKELERLAKENHELQEQLRQTVERFDVLANENDELKIQNDSKEKETMQLKEEVNQFREQATEHWRVKIEVEEKIIQVTQKAKEWKNKCEQSGENEEILQRENMNLKADLDKKNKEIQSLGKNLEELKKNQIMQQNKFLADDDKVELYHQIQQLQADIQRMKKKKVPTATLR